MFRLGVITETSVAAAPGISAFLGRAGSGASIDIIETHDVVFSQITPPLHLDDVQRNLPGILDAMAHANGNEDRFVLSQGQLLIAANDLRRSLNDDPVFGAVVMP